MSSRRRRKYYDPGVNPFPQNLGGKDRARVSRTKRRDSDVDRARLERAEAKRQRRGKR